MMIEPRPARPSKAGIIVAVILNAVALLYLAWLVIAKVHGAQ